MQNQNYLLELERELKYRNYSQKTIEVYTTCVKYFLKYINNNISKINKETVIDFILQLKTKNKAPKTVNLYKEAIKFFIENILQEKINIDIKLSREAKKLPIILTKNEILKCISI